MKSPLAIVALVLAALNLGGCAIVAGGVAGALIEHHIDRYNAWCHWHPYNPHCDWARR